MKFDAILPQILQQPSPPSRGAWIEIPNDPIGVGVPGASPPSRGAWIEMIGSYSAVMARYVAPLAGGVD